MPEVPGTARHLRAAIEQVKVRVHGRLPVDVDGLARDSGHVWRQRTLTPALTVWLFMLQVLHGNCAMTALRHLGGITLCASSYCAARARLPLALFARLFDAMSQYASSSASSSSSSSSSATLLDGRRVLLADATTFSTPDTAALRARFRYPPGQRDGCGFPAGKLLGVIDAVTGCVLVALGCPLFAHEAREMLTLHPLLRRGDVVVGDRAFGSFAQLALLARCGVDAVARLYNGRSTRAGAGRGHDYLDRWARPDRRPAWMPEAVWSSLPVELTVRIIRYTVPPRKGCRTRHVYVATTLLDPVAYPPELIVRLYGHRWHVETCFNHLKTHAGMNTLKSKTPDGVIKELIMYLVVWNLVRMTMMKFAERAGVDVWRVSFLDAVRRLCALLRGPRPVGPDLLRLLINPARPGRWEPRLLKRRLKGYDLLREPRPQLKAKHRARYA